MWKSWRLAAMALASLLILGCGEDSDGLTWNCGPEKKPRAVKAVLKDGTLTVSGKGAMRDYSETRVLDVMFGYENTDEEEFAKISAKRYKPYRAECWSPWYFTFVYDSAITIIDVVIENGITHIGNTAFAGLPELKSITIPASVSYIGGEALAGVDFRGNDSSLTTITVAVDNIHYSSDDGVLFNKDKTTLILYPRGRQQDTYTIPNSVTAIEKHAFRYCANLTSVVIPNSVTVIKRGAFGYCENLSSVTIPNSVTSIEGWAFSYCTNLTSVAISNSVTSIGEQAFGGCIGLTSITVAADNTYYCSENGVLFNKDKTVMIDYPTDRQGAYTIPNGVTSIDKAFSNCGAGLTSVTIPNSMTSIEHLAFDGCKGLTSVTIPNSVTSIGRAAFANCFSLSSITIPNSVNSIGDMAFRDCDGLKSITSQNLIPPEIKESTFDRTYCNVYNVCLYVPKGSIDAYRKADGWKNFNCIKAIATTGNFG